MAKTKLTLTVDDRLIEKIKIQAVKERRSVSDLTEQFYREHLERSKKRPAVNPNKSREKG